MISDQREGPFSFAFFGMWSQIHTHMYLILLDPPQPQRQRDKQARRRLPFIKFYSIAELLDVGSDLMIADQRASDLRLRDRAL